MKLSFLFIVLFFIQLCLSNYFNWFPVWTKYCFTVLHLSYCSTVSTSFSSTGPSTVTANGTCPAALPPLHHTETLCWGFLRMLSCGSLLHLTGNGTHREIRQALALCVWSVCLCLPFPESYSRPCVSSVTLETKILGVFLAVVMCTSESFVKEGKCRQLRNWSHVQMRVKAT